MTMVRYYRTLIFLVSVFLVELVLLASRGFHP